MTIYSGTPPDYPPVSAADISHVRDANDGSIFWTCQVSVSQQPPEQHVYRFVPSTGQSTPVKLEKTVTGRGQWCILNSQLYLSAWNETESPKRWYLIPVPDCKRPEPLNGAKGDPGPPGESADTTALERAIEDIQSELATMPGGALGDDQTKALAWLVRFLRQIGVLA